MAWPHTFDNDTVRAIIRNEGLLYAITSYTNGDPIEDEKLKALWKKTHNDIEFFQDFLEDHDLSPGILIHNKKGYFVIVDNEKTKYTEMPVSELGEMGKYITEKIHPQIIEILNILKMDVKEYGKKYHKGGDLGTKRFEALSDEFYHIRTGAYVRFIHPYDEEDSGIAEGIVEGKKHTDRANFLIVKVENPAGTYTQRNVGKNISVSFGDVLVGGTKIPIFSKGGLITKATSIFNKRVSLNQLFEF